MTFVPKYIQIAYGYLGQKEIKGKVNNSTIVRMFDRIRVGVNDDETPWCAAFVGNCLEEAGHRSTRSAWALSYATYGYPSGLSLGSIAYMARKNSAGKVIGGHVTFPVGIRKDGAIMCLGGNQGDQVSIAPFSPERILGYRSPVRVNDMRTSLPPFAMDGKPLSSNEA